MMASPPILGADVSTPSLGRLPIPPPPLMGRQAR